MKILILSQWFDPEPTFKGLLFAKELRRRGHEVEILTGFPNYPGGQLYSGYQMRIFQHEKIDGISVFRVPLYPSHDKSSARRVINYASFALSASLLGPIAVRRPDVIYVYHPPATIGLPAAVLKARFGSPVVYDIQDMWPDTIGASGMLSNQFALGAIAKWCQLVYRLADRLVVLSPGFKKLLIERGVPSSKIETIYNWTYEDSIGKVGRDENLEERLGLAGRFNVLFAGNMGPPQGLGAVLDAAQMLQSKEPNVQFVFVGDGIEREQLEGRAAKQNLSNVRFIERQPVAAMGPILAAADVLLIHLVNDPLFEITIPSKTQSSLVAGRPILMGVKGDAADLVESANAGLTCEPMSSSSICEGVKRLLKMDAFEREELGERGRKFYLEKLSLSVGVSRFEEVFKDAVGQ